MENCHKEKSKNWENDKVLLIIWQIIIFVAEEKRRRKETELDIFPEKNKLRKIRENRLFQQFLWVGGAGVDLCPSPRQQHKHVFLPSKFSWKLRFTLTEFSRHFPAEPLSAQHFTTPVKRYSPLARLYWLLFHVLLFFQFQCLFLFIYLIAFLLFSIFQIDFSI